MSKKINVTDPLNSDAHIKAEEIDNGASSSISSIKELVLKIPESNMGFYTEQKDYIEKVFTDLRSMLKKTLNAQSISILVDMDHVIPLINMEYTNQVRKDLTKVLEDLEDYLDI